MKTYKGIIFDLDGTLLDTIEDLRDSVNDVMKIYGWKEHDTKACKQMVGNGFRKLITRALPEDKQKNELFIDEAVNQFSKAYQKRYLNKTIPYEGILKLLESLEEKGIKIAVNSNKRGDYTSALVNKYFSQFPWTAVYGERESEGIPKKPDPSAALEIADLTKLPKEEMAQALGNVYAGKRPIAELTSKYDLIINIANVNASADQRLQWPPSKGTQIYHST